MLSSFATETSSSSASPVSSSYEGPPAWWKLNLTTTSCAALSAALFPSSGASTSTNLVETHPAGNVHHNPGRQSVSARASRVNDRARSLAHSNGHSNETHASPLRILLFAESFPSFTSGITRRFKEIIRRLAKRQHHIHVITGCKVKHTHPPCVFHSVETIVYSIEECSSVDRRQRLSGEVPDVLHTTIDGLHR